MVNRIRSIYSHGLNKGLLAPEFDMKHLKKANGHSGQNVSIIMKIKIIA